MNTPARKTALICLCMITLISLTGCGSWFDLFMGPATEPTPIPTSPPRAGTYLEVTAGISVTGMVVDEEREIWVFIFQDPEAPPASLYRIVDNGGTVIISNPAGSFRVGVIYDPSGLWNNLTDPIQNTFYMEYWDDLISADIDNGLMPAFISLPENSTRQLEIHLEERNAVYLNYSPSPTPYPTPSVSPPAAFTIEVYPAYGVPDNGDSILSLYNESMVEIAYNDNFDSPYSKIYYDLQAGTIYYIRVRGFSSTDQFGYALSVYDTSAGKPPALSNDGDGTYEDSNEPMNNDYYNGENLYLNSPAYRNIHCTDEDWFIFQIAY